MGKFKDLTGEKFGRLYVQYIKGKTKDNKRYIYHCICDCGNECDKLGELLSNGKTNSLFEFITPVLSEEISLTIQ